MSTNRQLPNKPGCEINEADLTKQSMSDGIPTLNLVFLEVHNLPKIFATKELTRAFRGLGFGVYDQALLSQISANPA